MSIDQATLGRRLKHARENRNLTQAAVAEALCVPRSAVAQIEAGNRSVSSLELSRLSDLYGRPIVDFFAEERPHEEDVLVALYRIDRTVEDDPNVREQVEHCVEICREGYELRKLLDKHGERTVPAYAYGHPDSVADAVRQGEAVAEQERKRLGIADGPIHVLSDLLAAQGLWVAEATLPDEISGLFLRHSSIGEVILVNQSHHRPRRRFSYAHEYGHAVLDASNTTAIVSSRRNAKDRTETRANAFAAAFLMPASGVESFLSTLGKGLPTRQSFAVYEVAGNSTIEAEARSTPGSGKIVYQDVAALARYFGTSYQAALYRLKDLGYIGTDERDKLRTQEHLGNQYLEFLKFKDATDRTETEPPSQNVKARELIGEVLYLAIEGYRREEITRGRLVQISRRLGLEADEVLRFAQETKQ